MRLARAGVTDDGEEGDDVLEEHLVIEGAHCLDEVLRGLEVFDEGYGLIILAWIAHAKIYYISKSNNFYHLHSRALPRRPTFRYPARALDIADSSPPPPTRLHRQNIIMQGSSLKSILPINTISPAVFLFDSAFRDL